MCPISLIVILAATSTFIGQVQMKCPDNCKRCLNETCKIFIEGTYMDSFGECKFCHGNCASCNSSDYCLTCQAGYYGLMCFNTCPSKHCVNKECDKDDGKCTVGCKEGYYQREAHCYPCFQSCKTCDRDGCRECDDGFYKLDGLCQKCNTSLDQSSGNCRECNDGYNQSGGQCEPCYTSCKTCGVSGCQVCNDGFYKIDGKCYPCDTECKICDESGCGECQDGFFQTDGTCVECDGTCKTCEDSWRHCLECKEGYYGPSCRFNCSFCKDGKCTKDSCYQVTTGKCVPCNDHCISCRTFEECDSCTDGYYGPNCDDGCSHYCISCNKRNGACTSVATSTADAERQQTTPTASSGMTTTVTQSRSTGYAFATDGSNSKNKLPHHRNNDRGDIIPLYLGIGGGGLVFIFIIIVMVIVYRRRSSRTQADIDNDVDMDGISMTENDRYVSADDYNLPRYTSSTGNGPSIPEGHATNDNIYSMPVKDERPPAVTMETNSDPSSSGSQQPPIPTKSEEYLDHD